MPKSKNTKSKSSNATSTKTGHAKKNRKSSSPAETMAAPGDQLPTGPGEADPAAQATKAKAYKTSKAPGLSHKQKAALAYHVMTRVGDLMAMDDAQLEKEELLGVDRSLMGAQLSAWVSYLPGTFWDVRLPQPVRERGRRKIA